MERTVDCEEHKHTHVCFCSSASRGNKTNKTAKRTHQKQPPAKVAMSFPSSLFDGTCLRTEAGGLQNKKYNARGSKHSTSSSSRKVKHTTHTPSETHQMNYRNSRPPITFVFTEHHRVVVLYILLASRTTLLLSWRRLLQI